MLRRIPLCDVEGLTNFYGLGRQRSGQLFAWESAKNSVLAVRHGDDHTTISRMLEISRSRVYALIRSFQ